MSRPTLEPWQDPNAKPMLSISKVSKFFDKVAAVNDLSLQIYKGELFALLGGSGCGKSTLLRILAGLERPSTGQIIIDGVDITDLPAYKRPVNMMFQSYALFPHMNVFQNVAFGLKQENLAKSIIQTRVKEVLDLVQMSDFQDRYPNQLSGGQQQRVALARSLVKRPKVLLLDEPLGALDKRLREQTQFELVNIQEQLGITFVVVTHDQEEAMTMSSRLGIMRSGNILQIGTPHDVYEYPNSRYVANFIGAVNLFDGIIEIDSADHAIIRVADLEKPLYISHSSSAPAGSEVSVSIRPEKIRISLSPPADSEYNIAKGVVKEIAYLGDVSIYHIELPSKKRIMATLTNLRRIIDREIQWDDTVYLFWRPDNGNILTT